MRVLWLKAPFVLRRHPPVLVAVIVMSALAALAAAATPVVRAGVRSESLKRQLNDLTPLAAGLEVTTAGPLRVESSRRAAAEALPKHVRFLGPPVAASLFPAQLDGSAEPGIQLMAMTRTNAAAHVIHVAEGGPSDGVWVADAVAQPAKLHPGDTMRLTVHTVVGTAPIVRMKVAGIYKALERDRDNPYWANWQQDIRPIDPNDAPPPPFVLMDRATFDRVARRLSSYEVQYRFEFPVDPRHISFVGAQRLDREITQLRARIERPGTTLERAFGCVSSVCRTSSSLSAALTVASGDVAAVGPTIFLLSACGVLIALGLCVAAGLFLVRRRSDEAHVLFARGESPVAFGSRTALETLIPVLAGLGIGLGVALLALHELAPKGNVDSGTVHSGLARGAVGCLAAVVCVAAGAVAGFPRRGSTRHAARWRRVPWEVAPLAAGAVLLLLVLTGHGMAHDETGALHPRLTVFVLPVLLVAGAAGLAVRAWRRALRTRGARGAVVFLAIRRLAAARGLLVAVIVASATTFGTYAYASTLTSSLERSTDEKAFVSNGSDVQGYVDPSSRILKPFPFPAVLVEVDQLNISFSTGERVDLIAGDPAAMRRTILWGDGWSDDPRPLLPRIEQWHGGPVPVLGTPGAHGDAIFDQGATIPIRIVGHAPFPGTTAGRPAIVMSRHVFRRVASRFHIFDPGPEASGFVWARGDPRKLEPVLEASSIAPSYMTTRDHIRHNTSVSAAGRSYRYVRLIGAAAAVLALVALLLYLQARQRSLLIASALVRRMGLGALSDVAAVALEAAAIVLLAALAGGVVAVLAARPIAQRLDALPQYAPAPVYVVPWTSLLVAVALATLVGAFFGAVATAVAQRSDVSEALRVA